MSKNDQSNLRLDTTDKLKFKKLYNVSRETMKKLETYEKYLLLANKQFNLIGSGTQNLYGQDILLIQLNYLF